MTADEAVGLLIQWMRDPEVPHGVRAKIAEDIADRAGLGSTQVIKVVGTEDDPIMRFFRDALNDPTALEAAPPPATHQPAIEAYAIGPRQPDAEPEEISEAELVEPEGEPADDTPPRIAEMIKAGAFDRKPGE
jgi:hypothetical protein